jgi:hypothetical protein
MMFHWIDYRTKHIAQGGQLDGSSPIFGRDCRSSVDDWEDTAREVHYLLIAVDLMQKLFEEPQSLRDCDAAFNRELAAKDISLSGKLAAAQDLVRELTYTSGGCTDQVLIGRAKTILVPLQSELDTLARLLQPLMSGSPFGPVVESEYAGK